MARHIELKTIKQEGGDFAYKDALHQIMSATPEGATYEQMRTVFKFVDQIDDAKHTLILDAGDYRTLCDKVKAHRWPMAHKIFIQFVDDILDAAEVEDKEDKAA